MKNTTKKLAAIIASLAIVLVGTLAMQAQAAGSATLTLDPASGEIKKGTTLTVSIFTNTSDPINAVQSDLSYDAAKLQFASISSSGTAFGLEAVATGGSGDVQIARGVSGGGTVTGTKKVASVSFTVLSDSGSTSITFASSSAILRSTDNTDIWNHSSAGASYTLKGTTTTPTKTKPAAPADTDDDQPDKPAPSAAETASADVPAEEPVKTSTDVTRTGYPVAVRVLDKHKKEVMGASVTLNNETVTTDSTGVASFSSVPAGTYAVKVAAEGQASYEQNIVVATGETSKVQEFSVQPAGAKSSTRPYVIAGIVVGIIVLLIGGIMLMNFLSNRRDLNRHVAPQPTMPPSNDVNSQLSNFKSDVPEPSQVIKPNDNDSPHL